MIRKFVGVVSDYSQRHCLPTVTNFHTVLERCAGVPAPLAARWWAAVVWAVRRWSFSRNSSSASRTHRRDSETLAFWIPSKHHRRTFPGRSPPGWLTFCGKRLGYGDPWLSPVGQRERWCDPLSPGWWGCGSGSRPGRWPVRRAVPEWGIFDAVGQWVERVTTRDRRRRALSSLPRRQLEKNRRILSSRENNYEK